MAYKKPSVILEHRDISWLSFNARVLQEAGDPRTPLFERLQFLAIYSANLDEFFRVRVASIRSLLSLKRRKAKKLDFNPARLLYSINQIVIEQQERFGEILRRDLVPALHGEGIDVITEKELDQDGLRYVRDFFDRHVRARMQPTPLPAVGEDVFLKNRTLYLVTEIWHDDGGEPAYHIVEVPSPPLDRFVVIPGEVAGRRRVMFLEDVIRCNVQALYPDRDAGFSYAVKLSRDAELYLDDEFSGDLVQMIKKSLARRETGAPCRFLYDMRMPFSLAAALKDRLALDASDMVPGGRYHNLHDLFAFPRTDRPALSFEPMPPHPHPDLEQADSIFAAVDGKDHMLHVPYQSYAPVIRFFEEAALDDAVEGIWVSLYRVARDSAVVRALIEAARRGKRVHAFVEVKARFDEESNLYWAEQMEQAGVRVMYSMPGLKVHAKIALVKRRESGRMRRYAYLATGNFNEKTARIYADDGLFTADERLTREVERVFAFLGKGKEPAGLQHLLVAPFTLRKAFNRLIDREIERARAGKRAWMILKMNSLEDEKIIHRLYRASDAGVDIRLIVRGICRLVPGIEGQSERIQVTSIVDRFLEHSRVYIFGNGGRPLIYLASADWMERNLSRRVEVAFPVYDPVLRREVRRMIDIQLRDNTKARIIDSHQRNAYVERGRRRPVRAQYALYEAFCPATR